MAAEDPSVSGVSGRYATALFELAGDERSIDAVRADLDRFDAMLADSADLKRLVRSPVFSADSQSKALAAVTLSDKNLDALKTALKSVTGKDVALNVKIDPSIIGGLVVKLGSRMVDSSLRTKLNSIKHAMKDQSTPSEPISIGLTPCWPTAPT